MIKSTRSKHLYHEHDATYAQQMHDTSALPNGLPAHDFYRDGSHGDMPSFAAQGMPPSHPHPGHQGTESEVNLPPPEVARMIPCRFFPNCRYGDQCIFAHPIMVIPSAPLPDGAPLSPSLASPPPPHMQPIFYQPMPQGYQYPAPYSSFYPQMGPTSLLQQPQYLPNGQYTSPINQNQTQYPFQHSHDSQYQHTNSIPIPFDGLSNTQAEQYEKRASAQQDDESASQAFTGVVAELDNNVIQQGDAKDAINTPPQQDNTPDTALAEGDSKAAHRRQSFNSFLQYHAIPFQPNGPAQAAIHGSMMNGIGSMQAFIPNNQRFVPKPKKMLNGLNGFGKRSNGERPACSFFANGRCKNGDDCRFPHILPDGSDARSVQSQHRMGVEMTHNPSFRPNHDGGVPAFTPTGPAAARNEERHLNQRGEKEHQNGATTSNYKKTSPSLTSGQINGHANGIVRSNPSRTSKQDFNNARGQSNGPSSNASSKKSHHTSQQSVQRIPTVNDFPALAITSPNLGSKDNGEFQSTHRNGQMKSISTDVLDSNGLDHDTKKGSDENANGNGHQVPLKANFSAILSAPAPVRTRASSSDNLHEVGSSEHADTINANSESSHQEEAIIESSLKVPVKSINGSGPSNGSSNGAGSTTSRIGNGHPEATPKGYSNGSYRAVAAAQAPTSQARAKTDEQGEDDDFQLVNRSRAINKKSPTVHHHRPSTNATEGYAAHANAVAA